MHNKIEQFFSFFFFFNVTTDKFTYDYIFYFKMK